MAYDDHSAFVFHELLLECAAPIDVEVGGWFVKHQHVGFRCVDAGEGESDFFAAAKDSHGFKSIVAAESECSEKRSSRGLC